MTPEDSSEKMFALILHLLTDEERNLLRARMEAMIAEQAALMRGVCHNGKYKTTQE